MALGQEAHDDNVRQRYLSLLEKERRILERAGQRAGPRERQLLEQAGGVHGDIATHQRELETFRSRLETLVARRAADIKAQVLFEQSTLSNQRNTIESAKDQAKHVVGKLALSSLGDVEKKFHDIVLRGDVGLIDVVWQLKEEQTDKINERVTEQRRELETMDREFKEVLADD